MSVPKKPSKKRAPRKPKKPSEAEFKPLKIVGCVLVGGRYNEHGDLIGEEAMTDANNPFILYAPDFSKVDQIVKDAVKRASAAEQQKD